MTQTPSNYTVDLSHNQLSFLHTLLLNYQYTWRDKGDNQLPPHVQDLLSSTLIHDIQMILHINKSKPIRVYAEAVIRECKNYDSHDAVMALLKFEDESIASFETSWVLPKNQPEPLDPALHVIGDKGSIIIESSSMGMQVQTEKSFN